MSLILKATQGAPLTVAYTDPKGNEAKVQEGSVEWGVSDPGLLRIAEDQSNEKAAMLTAVGPVGTGQANVTCDADLGEGVKPLILTLDVEIVAADAVAGTINAGEPVEIPTPPPDVPPGGPSSPEGRRRR